VIGFILVLAILWGTELFNLTHYFFNLPPTKFSWAENLFETALIVIFAGAIIGGKCYRAKKDRPLKILLPICSHCKSIRNGQDNWQQVDDYISEQTDLDFTHTICPHCTKIYYPEIFAQHTKPSQKPVFRQ